MSGHWMITSTATGDDIDWIPAQEPRRVTVTPRRTNPFVGFAEVVTDGPVMATETFEWGSLGEQIRPLAVDRTLQIKKKVDHFTEENEKELFEF